MCQLIQLIFWSTRLMNLIQLYYCTDMLKAKKLITNKQEKGLLVLLNLLLSFFGKNEQKLEDNQSNSKRMMYFC